MQVTFDPPLIGAEENSERVGIVQQKLASGLQSLAPGRVIRWNLGPGYKITPRDQPQAYVIRIDAEGPHGQLPTFEFTVDIADWRQSRDAPDGSLHHVKGAVEKLAESLDSIGDAVRRLPG